MTGGTLTIHSSAPAYEGSISQAVTCVYEEFPTPVTDTDSFHFSGTFTGSGRALTFLDDNDEANTFTGTITGNTVNVIFRNEAGTEPVALEFVRQ